MLDQPHVRRGRGRPSYGERRRIVMRIPEQHMPVLEREAAAQGFSSVSLLVTSMDYDALGESRPDWVEPKSGRGAVSSGREERR